VRRRDVEGARLADFGVHVRGRHGR
jgi:hypothetical protein